MSRRGVWDRYEYALEEESSLVLASAELDEMTAEELASDVAMEEEVVTSDAVAESEACPPGAAATYTISTSLGTLRRAGAPDDEETDASELAAESRRLQDAARRIGAIAKDVPPGEGEEERGERRGQQRPEPRPMDAGERKGRKGRRASGGREGGHPAAYQRDNHCLHHNAPSRAQKNLALSLRCISCSSCRT
jgi:hypothetical protein